MFVSKLTIPYIVNKNIVLKKPYLEDTQVHIHTYIIINIIYYIYIALNTNVSKRFTN